MQKKDILMIENIVIQCVPVRCKQNVGFRKRYKHQIPNEILTAQFEIQRK